MSEDKIQEELKKCQAEIEPILKKYGARVSGVIVPIEGYPGAYGVQPSLEKIPPAVTEGSTIEKDAK